MIVIIAIDDNYGMLFNHRRVSKDEELRNRIIELIGDSKLFMNEYSFMQFKDNNCDRLKVYEDFMEKAEKGEYCFVENICVDKYIDSIEKIILFEWNRKYPSDFRFNEKLLDKFIFAEEYEFKGKSHEKISEKVYEKC